MYVTIIRRNSNISETRAFWCKLELLVDIRYQRPRLRRILVEKAGVSKPVPTILQPPCYFIQN